MPRASANWRSNTRAAAAEARYGDRATRFMPTVFTRSTAACFVLVAVASAWLCASLPVFAQEAYYWTYAQHPDLSYFDHPPMVAWLIWLGTSVFGDGAAGIRLGTWTCGMVTTWTGARILARFGVDATGQRGWILVSVLSPILGMAHCLANPDPPLVCGWTVALFALWRARDGGLVWWLLAGVAAGCALLSKYTAIFLAPAGLALLLFDPAMRRQLRRPGPYLAVLVAAIVFLPVLAWNVRNDFESFRFQTESRFAAGRLGTAWLTEFLGGQFAALHPALAVALPFAVVWAARRSFARDPRAAWLLVFGLPLPLYLLANSLFIQVKINWVAPAYVPLVLAIVVWWRESGIASSRPTAIRVAVLSLLVVLLAVPLAPAWRLIPPGKGSSWIGWDEIAARAEAWEDRIDAEDGIEGNVFFFGADYRDAAQLGRALKILWKDEDEHPGPAGGRDSGEPTLAQNVFAKPALQYDHWEPPANRTGQDAIFVLPRPDDREAQVEEATRCFVKVEKVERVTIRRLGIHLLDADIYVCHTYRGPQKRP